MRQTIMMTSFKTRNLIAVLFTGFVNYWEWTVLLASIYPYIASMTSGPGEKAEFYFALAQSSFPLGQSLSLPISTKLVKRLGQIKGVELLLILVAIGGNVLYLMAEYTGVLMLIVLGRLVAGLGAGSGGVAYGFIAANTASHERSKHIMAYRSVCMLGILSATLSSATFLPGFGSTGVGDSLCLNRFTAPAAFSILLMTIALLITAFLLDEEECVPTGEKETQMYAADILKLHGVHLVLLLFFLTGFMTTWITYVMPLVAFPVFNWEVPKFGWLLLGVSGAAVIGSLSTAHLSRTRLLRSDGQWKVIVLSCSFQLLGVVLCFCGVLPVLKSIPLPWKEGLFIAGAALVFFTYSVCGVALPVLASRFVSTLALPVFLPYCLVFISAGKFVAPLLTLAELRIQGWELVFSVLVVFIVVVLALFPWLYRRRTGTEQAPLLSDDTPEQTTNAGSSAPDHEGRSAELGCTVAGSFPKSSIFNNLSV